MENYLFKTLFFFLHIVTDEILGELPENVRDEFVKLREENGVLKSHIAQLDPSKPKQNKQSFIVLTVHLI